MEYFNNRFIAMLDILGMSNRLSSRTSMEETLKTYSEIVAAIKETAIQHSTLENRPDLSMRVIDDVYFVFDNIVVVSKGDSASDASIFMAFIAQLMANFALNNMPLRGAISYGDFCVDKKSGIFLSNVFKEISTYERHQNWSGCIVLKNCEEKVATLMSLNEVGTRKSTSGLLTYVTPFKCKSDEAFLCINWMSGFSEDQIIEMLGFMKEDLEKKINTEKFVNYFKSLGVVRSKLPDSYLPATYATATLFGSAASFIFWNSNHQRSEIGSQHYSCEPLPNDEGFIFYE